MKPKEQGRYTAPVNLHVAGRISTGGMPVMRVVGVLVCALWVVAMMTGAAGAGGPKIPPVGTWKAELFPWSSSDTIDRTIAALPKDLQVLALQDIFLDEEGLLAFARALRRSYPFSYHVPPDTPRDIACVSELPAATCLAVTGLDVTNCVPLLAGSLLSCLEASGFSLDRVTIDDIFASTCAPMAAALLTLDNQCPACLITAAKENGGNGQQTFDACLAQQNPRYDYGGSVGQLILSKHPLKDVEVVDFPSYIERRVNVYATIGGVRYGFASYPIDILGDLGLTGYLPPLPGVLQPVLAQEMIDSDADVLLGSFWSGTRYQPDAYNDLLASFQDLAPGALTYCTQAMIDAQDPRCVVQTPGGLFTRGPLDLDHVFVRNGSADCFRSDAAELFAETPGISDHVGLRVKPRRAPSKQCP